MPQVELLSRPGCHLCDEAMEHLANAIGRDRIVVRDISAHQDLEDQFVFRIPVVRLDQRVIAEGVIDTAEARRVKSLLQKHARSSMDSSA